MLSKEKRDILIKIIRNEYPPTVLGHIIFFSRTKQDGDFWRDVSYGRERFEGAGEQAVLDLIFDPSSYR